MDGDGDVDGDDQALFAAVFAEVGSLESIGCGLGFEIAVLLAPLSWWRARRRT